MTSGKVVPLASLAPEFDEDQHSTYLRRLEEAVDEPKNLNIALTGRYGAGKSSVLEKFIEQHSDVTLRLAISTLGPSSDGASDEEQDEASDVEQVAGDSLTNRIQKELVKQLIYSASAKILQYSRFKRIQPTPLGRAVGECAVAVAVVGALLALLGWLPTPAWAGIWPWPARAAGWTVVFVLAVAIVTTVRQVTLNRYLLTSLSAVGASVTLSERSRTYFDEYLDVIVRFFDEEPMDIVVFEDLDRFDDPYIFEALRELNTLLNTTRDRQGTSPRPLRFVYAMRDSLFEELGADSPDGDETTDAARAETIRANRTKFFDVVIPLVPFISHRNAREHLHKILHEAGITDVDRRLVELVAQHATDHRLLVNMRNEYLVYSERLLSPYTHNPAPGLTASRLFALIAYKSFHMKDFEDISRRRSDLDTLYTRHNELVRAGIKRRDEQRRDLAAGLEWPETAQSLAKRLGDHLAAIAPAIRANAARRVPNNHKLRFTVAGEHYAPEAATTPDFWNKVATARKITLGTTPNPDSPPDEFATLESKHLDQIFPEIRDGRWQEHNALALRDESHQLRTEIELLRGADFADLVQHPEFTMPAEKGGDTFKLVVDKTLKSELARSLVRHGYIDRNFTAYSTQFYGDFAGVDVATFVVQHVNTNEMNLDYDFTSAGAIPNLLHEAGEEFPDTVSAYNIQILDHLLKTDDVRAVRVVKHLITDFDTTAQEFLTAYLSTDDAERSRLAAYLSRQGWRPVFTYLSSDEAVPADARRELVDAALRAAGPADTYDLDDEFAEFLTQHYPHMQAFTAEQDPQTRDHVVDILKHAGGVLPDLAPLDERLRRLVVEHRLYQLTAGNLRTALSVTGPVSLDQARRDDAVYAYCLDHLDRYLDTVADDPDTRHAVETPETLADVLSSNQAKDDEPVERLAASASPDSSLPDITTVPESTWPALAVAKVFRPSVANIEAYRAELGIDDSLGGLLGSIDAITTATPADTASQETPAAAPDTAANLAVAILNAGTTIKRPGKLDEGVAYDPEQRVRLVTSLDCPTPLAVAPIKTEASRLFALLLQHGLIEDSAATFTHLHDGGWEAIQPAILASGKIGEFLEPPMIDGFVDKILDTEATADKIGPKVLDDLAAYLPTDDADALVAAARFAVRKERSLPLDQIKRIAPLCRKEPSLVVELLSLRDPAAQDADNIVAVLAALGEPYDNLSTRAKTKFDVPDDPAHTAVFKILKEADVCDTRERRGRLDITIG